MTYLKQCALLSRRALASFAAMQMILAVFIGSAAADMIPGTRYDASVPTLKQVVGHDFGERITSPLETEIYLKALVAAAPDRLKLVSYAQSWEGRPLYYLVVSSADNISALETIQANMKLLADPRTISRAEAVAMAETLPGVAWLTYGVHGNEISSTDAALFLAYHLLAARGDELVSRLLSETVVLIDPMQNPDGRARFVHNFEFAEGLKPDADRLAAEHQEPWPGGRTNHYLFDMNRDWFALTQPETRGRIKTYLDWYPLAVVDAHEMSGDSSYYFAPPAPPINPAITDTQIDRLTGLGRTIAKWFDTFGFDYFTREIFDAFYPGYGDSWPALHGSISSTYEQGSARGLLWRRADGEVMTYAQTVQGHVVSSLATLEMIADNRQALITEFYDYRRSAIDMGRGARTRAYLIPGQKNQAGADRLAGLLESQGISVARAGEAFKACGTSYAAGSYIVDAAQPSHRLLTVLMDTDVPLSPHFVEEQERRRKKDLGHELYDVTSWSLPLMFGVSVDTCKVLPKVAGEDDPQGPSTLAASDVAYLVPWQDVRAVRLLSGVLEQGIKVRSSDEGFRKDGRDFPSGTLVVPARGNIANLREALERISRDTGAEVIPVQNSWVEEGPNFGSDNVLVLHPPRIAMAWDIGTSGYSAGNTRFVIERQLGHPVTIIRTSTLPWADLSDFDVLILPEQGWVGYDAILGKRGAGKLASFVENGGVLVGLGSAMRFMSNPENGLVSVRREKAFADKEAAPATEDSASVKGEIFETVEAYDAWRRTAESAPDALPGALVKAEPDSDHWLSSGLETMHVLVGGQDIYTPLKRGAGVNAVRFAGPEELLVSGYMWEENRKQMAFKPFVIVQPRGRGMVIGFTSSPTTRAYLDGLNMVLANAIFRGPAHADVLH